MTASLSDTEFTFGTSSEEDKAQILDLLIQCFTTAEPIGGSLAKQGVHSIEDFSKTYVEVIEKSAESEYSIFARDGTNIVGVQFAYPTTVEA